MIEKLDVCNLCEYDDSNIERDIIMMGRKINELVEEVNLLRKYLQMVNERLNGWGIRK
jgi:hypothetical protein